MRGSWDPRLVLDPFGGELHPPRATPPTTTPRLRALRLWPQAPRPGLAVSKYLIGVKLAGQAAVASELLLAPDVSTTILELAEMVERLSSLEEIRQHEAVAANLYWNAWSAVMSGSLAATSHVCPTTGGTSTAGGRR